MEEVQEKLKRILDLASPEDKEKLRVELAKMVPLSENSKVTTKIGWGHHENLIQTSFTFMVVSYKEDKETKKEENLLFSELLNKSELSYMKINEGFSVILDEKPKKINIGFIPALEISEKTKACSISFKIQ